MRLVWRSRLTHFARTDWELLPRQELDCGSDERVKVPVEGGDRLLVEASDATRVILELLIHRIRDRAGHKAAGTAYKCVGKVGKIAMKDEFTVPIWNLQPSTTVRCLSAGFLGVRGRH